MAEGWKFWYAPPEGASVELEAVQVRGPLSIARVFDYRKRRLEVGLYWIYLNRHGAQMGPFFAEIALAERSIAKILKEFGASTFEQPLQWIRRQSALRDWIVTNVGKSADLIGGEWMD